MSRRSKKSADVLKRNTDPDLIKSPSLEKKKVHIDHKRKQLIQKLHTQIANLSHIDHKLEPETDLVIDELESVILEAKDYDLKEIVKMGELAIGKRILNIELNRKRAEVESKKKKKREIEEMFRENRINKVNYEKIANLKSEENCLIIKPYSNGRGFIQTEYFYEKVISPLTGKTYHNAFRKAQVSQVTKKVNLIFFKNFSQYSSAKSQEQALANPILKLVYIIVIALVLMCTIAMFKYLPGLNIAILAAAVLITVLTVLVSIHAYLEEVNHNGPLDETMAEVKKEFLALNAENEKKGSPFRWSFPNSFMFLEVKMDESAGRIQD